MMPPFDTFGHAGAAPLVVSVPHAGRAYPPGCERLLAVPLVRTVGLEDRCVDVLLERLVADGHHVMVARTPRLIVDLNRAEDDLDVGMGAMDALVSARARAGLGVVPTRLGGVELLWRTVPDAAEIERRLMLVHRPYHRALAAALATARARWGFALLIDLHSMPPLPGAAAAQVVLGDRRGTTAGTAVTVAAQAAAEAAGFRTVRNVPYAGGHIVTRHGRPLRDVHAIQIEVDRRCYLDHALMRPAGGRHRVAAMLADAARRMLGVLGEPLAIAAE